VPISIVIVDDHDAVRRALRRFFGSFPDFQVCGEAADGLDAIENTKRLKPDVLLQNFAMPRLDGLQAARAISPIFPNLPMVMLTSHKSELLESSAQGGRHPCGDLKNGWARAVA